MIPTISPPTDSLYKLMSLFGLGLFILGVINNNTFSDDLVRTKVQIETIQDSIASTIFAYGEMTPEFEQNMRKMELSQMNLEELSNSLESLETYIFAREKIPGNVKSTLSTQIDIIQIKYDFLKEQKTMNYFILVIASVLMVIGFILWYIKDQRLQDLQLRNTALNSEKGKVAEDPKSGKVI